MHFPDTSQPHFEQMKQTYGAGFSPYQTSSVLWETREKDSEPWFLFILCFDFDKLKDPDINLAAVSADKSVSVFSFHLLIKCIILVEYLSSSIHGEIL